MLRSHPTTARETLNLIDQHIVIPHHALTFPTDHDSLIEKLASVLTTKYTWDKVSAF